MYWKNRGGFRGNMGTYVPPLELLFPLENWRKKSRDFE